MENTGLSPSDPRMSTREVGFTETPTLDSKWNSNAARKNTHSTFSSYFDQQSTTKETNTVDRQ